MTDHDLVRTATDSPVGVLTALISPVGLRALAWPGDDAARVPDLDRIGDEVPMSAPSEAVSPTASRVAEAVDVQLREYFAGERTSFDIPLDPVGSPFQLAAWSALREIPYGETVSYGQQAERMGDANKARAVGAANARNPISIIVPCHRVVGKDGSLTGFAGGVEVKRYLLELERRVAGHTLL
jgi:methylated-DNA-[protein]-cysteine S-methyltransferase